MKKLSGGCTLDCFDCCKFNVYVEDNKVMKIEGDKDHPYTKGFICKKGFMHLNRAKHSSRQYSPLLKVEGTWKEISFIEALDIVYKKLDTYKNEYGNKSILYYEQYGSGSVLKTIGDLFFNFFGGCTKQKGGPCWSAGMAAQKQNFGDAKSHSLEDMLNSKTILVWGKNPANTTIHTMQMIRRAKQNGSYVIVIDPIFTDTAKQADYYVNIKPNGDAALALAMGKMIIETEKYDKEYIKKYVNGFEEYREYVESLDLDELCKIAGVTLDTVKFLVTKYSERYSTILLGYGMQKYSYGGNTISLVNTLGAITGQIGESGGGVNYANKVYPKVLNTDPYESTRYAHNNYFYVSNICECIKENNIKMAFITSSNLLNQLPGLNKLEEAFDSIDFKVCFDLFLTDTAEKCDLFIPVTSVFEGEDLLYSSMTNPYLTYIEKAVEPKEELMDEYYFYQRLAEKLSLKNFPSVDKKEYLEKVIEPLKKIEPKMSLEYLKNNYFTIHEDVAWNNKEFLTEDKKFKIVINNDALNKSVLTKELQDENSFRLLAVHGRESLSSQHYMDNTEVAEAYINLNMAEKYDFKENELVFMESSEGKIRVKIKIDDKVSDDIVLMNVGWWKRSGNPNYIIKSGISDIGGQVTYNETFVHLYR